jgi:hypothetical protein
MGCRPVYILSDVNGPIAQMWLMQCIKAKTQTLRDQPIQRAVYYSYRPDQGSIGQRWQALCPWLCDDKRGSRSKEQMPSAVLAARLCPVGIKVGLRVKSLGKSWKAVAVRGRSLPVCQRGVRSCMESYTSFRSLKDSHDHREKDLETCMSEDSSCLSRVHREIQSKGKSCGVVERSGANTPLADQDPSWRGQDPNLEYGREGRHTTLLSRTKRSRRC